jgi:non-ribosomal peptide synthetase component F
MACASGWPLEAGGSWLSATSYSFDISVLEIFGSLCHGFSLVLLGEHRWGVASEWSTASRGSWCGGA